MVVMTTPAERVWSAGGNFHQTRHAIEKADMNEEREETEAKRWWSTLCVAMAPV